MTLIEQDLDFLSCFGGGTGTHTYSSTFRQLESQPVWLYCHSQRIKSSDVEFSTFKSVLPQSEVKVVSSNLDECRDTTHCEKHLLLSPFFCDNNKLSHLSRHWPTIDIAMVSDMQSKLGNLKTSDLVELPILFTGGKGALVRGTLYEENTWTVRLFYGLKAAFTHICFSCPVIEHVAAKTAFSSLVMKHTGLSGYESIFPFNGIPDILVHPANILSVDPADILEDTLQAHKQDVVPPKVGQLITYLHISALLSMLKSLLLSASLSPVTTKGLLVYKQIGCSKVVLVLSVTDVSEITSTPKGMSVKIFVEDVSILNERSLCASIQDWIK